MSSKISNDTNIRIAASYNTSLSLYARAWRMMQWAAIGALLLLALINPTSTAQAVSIDWDTLALGNATNLPSGQVVQSLDDAGNCTVTPPFTDCEVEVTMTFELNNDGNGGQLNCGFGGNNCVRYYNDQIGGIADGDLRLGVDATAADGGQDDMRMCIEFNREVQGLQFEILDIDDASWDDSVELTYVPFLTSTPMLQRTDLINAVGFGDTTTGVNTNHVTEHNPAFAAPDNEVLGWGAIQAPPAGNATAADDGGNVSIDFGTQQVGGFCIRYFAGPNSTANPGFQWIALGQLTWTTTLPVDLAFVESSKSGRSLDVKWSTSAESFNLGFNLWGELDGDWVALNRNVLASNVVDSVNAQVYEKRVRLNRTTQEISRFGISSVDILGNESFYGPFEFGQRYGEDVLPEPIDWQAVVAEHAARMQARGYALFNGRWKKRSAALISGSSSSGVDGLVTTASFDKAGMARLHHQDLLQAGLDLTGVARNEIAVSHLGKPVARRVAGLTDGRFTSDSYIDFLVEPLADDLMLYNDENHYQIARDAELVRNVRVVKSVEPSAAVTGFIKEFKVENDTRYLNLSKAGTPWMDTSYGLGAVKSTQLHIDLPQDYIVGSDVILSINLHGGFDHPTVEKDHIVKVLVGGVELNQKSWAGISPTQIEVTISGEMLSDDGEVGVTLEAIPNSAGFALQYLDNYSVRYSAPQTSLVGTQGFGLTQSGDYFELTRAQARGVRSYMSDAAGNLVRIRPIRVKQQGQPAVFRYPRSADLSARYYLLHNDDFLTPSAITSRIDTVSDRAAADLYIIAHPSFMGEALSNYAAHKQATGVATQLVDYEQLVQEFGYGFDNPLVIREFLKSQDAVQNVASALIVGGHSFDYLDRTGQGSVSFIPTNYRPSSVINYSPTDTPLTDLDADGLPDVAVGRWPVREIGELETIIEKSIAWSNGEGAAASNSVLLVAESQDRNSGISFAQQLNDLSARFDPGNEYQGGFWGDVTRLYASDFASSVSPVAEHKAAMIAELERGHAMTIFNGHGSTNSWTYSGLFRVGDITSIQDQGKASVYFPLACYTTYYETIGNNSLAHQLLFKPSGGAVMIVGAATLGDFTSNGVIADRVMQSQIDERLDLGDSLMRAKRSMGPKNQDAANLWTMLGDPTLRFNGDFVKVPVSHGDVSEISD